MTYHNYDDNYDVLNKLAVLQNGHYDDYNRRISVLSNSRALTLS